MSGSLFGAEAAITGPSPDWRYRAGFGRGRSYEPWRGDWDTVTGDALTPPHVQM